MSEPGSGPGETWIDRFVREVESLKKQWRVQPGLTAIFLLGVAIYGWHEFGPSLELPGPGQNDPTVAAAASPNLPTGTTGWIYVGTQVNSEWKHVAEDGAEPSLTLDTGGLPTRGLSYRVTRPVNLRDSLPKSNDGTRPPMPTSVGTIRGGSEVKIDDVRSLEIPDPPRTWVWAHVTLVQN